LSPCSRVSARPRERCCSIPHRLDGGDGSQSGLEELMGDKGQKDKDKGQKQHAAKDKQEEKKKLERQPKRTS